MKAFSFRLEPILLLREGARKNALASYARSIIASKELEKKLDSLNKSLGDLQKDISKQRQKVFSPSTDVPNQAAIVNLNKKIDSTNKSFEEAKANENKLRLKFLDADNALKSVSRLKEKQESAHIEEQTSREELALEDVINSRFNFNSNTR